MTKVQERLGVAELDNDLRIVARAVDDGDLLCGKDRDDRSTPSWTQTSECEGPGRRETPAGP